MIRPPPSSTRTDPLFPFPTLFRASRLAAGARLDHADHPVARHRIANHRPIARLEDVQRQAAAWKHQCARKREYRNIGREILVSHHSDPFASGKQNSRKLAALRQRPGIIERSEERLVGKEGVSTCKYRWRA